jgi:lactoylglutathione lyase
MIDGVSLVVVSVEDPETAREFWVDRLGFDLRRDESYGDERWIEVSPPGQDIVLALTKRAASEGLWEAPDQLSRSPLIFKCADIEETYAELRARGVEFPTPPDGRNSTWWATFADPDGTRYALAELG